MVFNKIVMLNFAAGVLMAALLTTGFIYASRKPLWNDELYSQIGGVEKKNYRQILAGEIEEGNNSPLFYLIQKFVCHVAGFRLPFVWDGQGYMEDERSQIILRISSNVFMSAAVVSLFYFFARNVSLWLGVYALLLALSSHMVWVYWAEARPYSLWFLLTTWQFLFFYRGYCQKAQDVWKHLAVVHLLLALTAVMSVISIVVVSFLIWILKERHNPSLKDLGQKFLGLVAVPVVILVTYYSLAPHYKWRIPSSLYQLIYPCSSEDQWIIWGFYLLVTLMVWFSRVQMRRHAAKIFCALALIVLAVAIMCEFFRMRQPPGMEGFEIVSRYFIFLVPAGLIVTIVAAHDLLSATMGRWFRINVVVGLAGLLTIRFLKSDAIWMWFEFFRTHVKL